MPLTVRPKPITINYSMEEAKLLERIVTDAKVMVGNPIIKNTRLTVEYIMGLLAEGAGEEEILSE